MNAEFEKYEEFEEFLCERMDIIVSAAHALLGALAGPVEEELALNFQIQDVVESVMKEAGIETCRPFFQDEGSERKPCYLTGDCANGNCPFAHLQPQKGGEVQ